jgi:hypothetical protein
MSIFKKNKCPDFYPCNDGTFSTNNSKGACTKHGGLKRTVKPAIKPEKAKISKEKSKKVLVVQKEKKTAKKPVKQTSEDLSFIQYKKERDKLNQNLDLYNKVLNSYPKESDGRVLKSNQDFKYKSNLENSKIALWKLQKLNSKYTKIYKTELAKEREQKRKERQKVTTKPVTQRTVYQHKHIPTLTATIIKPTENGYQLLTKNTKGITTTEKKGKKEFFSTKQFLDLFIKKIDVPTKIDKPETQKANPVLIGNTYLIDKKPYFITASDPTQGTKIDEKGKLSPSTRTFEKSELKNIENVPELKKPSFNKEIGYYSEKLQKIDIGQAVRIAKFKYKTYRNKNFNQNFTIREYVKNIKPIINIEQLRDFTLYVNVDEYVTYTDAHVLLTLSNWSNIQDGLYNVNNFTDDSNALKYPNYKAVIPDYYNGTKLDIPNLLNYLDLIEKAKLWNLTTKQIALICKDQNDNNINIGLNGKLLSNLLKTLINFGNIDDYYFYADTPNKAFLIKNDIIGLTALIMPVMLNPDYKDFAGSGDMERKIETTFFYNIAENRLINNQDRTLKNVVPTFIAGINAIYKNNKCPDFYPCNDGTFSTNNSKGACTKHGGLKRTVKPAIKPEKAKKTIKRTVKKEKTIIPDASGEYCIHFLNKDKNFQEDVICFKSYEDAEKWGNQNLGNFKLDMIRIRKKPIVEKPKKSVKKEKKTVKQRIEQRSNKIDDFKQNFIDTLINTNGYVQVRDSLPTQFKPIISDLVTIYEIALEIKRGYNKVLFKASLKRKLQNLKNNPDNWKKLKSLVTFIKLFDKNFTDLYKIKSQFTERFFIPFDPPEKIAEKEKPKPATKQGKVNIGGKLYDYFYEKQTVESYPYGRLRTTAYFSIETTKKGDRTVFQTINPKTGRINNPKKSTYSNYCFMYKNEDDHIKFSCRGYNDLNSFRNLIQFIQDNNLVLNEQQKANLIKDSVLYTKLESQSHINYGFRDMIDIDYRKKYANALHNFQLKRFSYEDTLKAFKNKDYEMMKNNVLKLDDTLLDQQTIIDDFKKVDDQELKEINELLEKKGKK